MPKPAFTQETGVNKLVFVNAIFYFIVSRPQTPKDLFTLGNSILDHERFSLAELQVALATM